MITATADATGCIVLAIGTQGAEVARFTVAGDNDRPYTVGEHVQLDFARARRVAERLLPSLEGTDYELWAVAHP